jgi:hypothetical protein
MPITDISKFKVLKSVRIGIWKREIQYINYNCLHQTSVIMRKKDEERRKDKEEGKNKIE